MLRASALFVLAALAIVFAVLNLDEVEVHWAFGSGNAPLIVVIVISLLVGCVFTYFGERVKRNRRQAAGRALLGDDLDGGLGADERREHDVAEVIGDGGEQLDAPAGDLAADRVPDRARDGLGDERAARLRRVRPR